MPMTAATDTTARANPSAWRMSSSVTAASRA
jgi:hypothetical protein